MTLQQAAGSFIKNKLLSFLKFFSKIVNLENILLIQTPLSDESVLCQQCRKRQS